jgi:hypothetical protein
MMLRGHNRTAAASHLRVEWRPCTLASFGQNACPNTPSIHLGMHLIGVNSTGSTKSAERLFSDYRRRVH